MGGGIVIIHAKHIVGNGFTIDASGDDVATPTGGIDGGGGGGAGGTVAFEIETISGTLNVNANGGDGQDLATTVPHGPGGGGGGGVCLHNLATLPPSMVVTANGGIGGEHTDGFRHNSEDGEVGGIVSYFHLVYTGSDNDDDGLSNFCDIDTDNDGILDVDEDGGTGTDPSKDEDGDGIANCIDDNDLTVVCPSIFSIIPSSSES